METPLEQLLQKDCPFEPWMFLLTEEVLNWTLDNVEDAELNKLHVQTITERIDYYLFNYFYEKSGLKAQKRLLKDCTIAELEAELKRRKEQV
jgi:hypothetical protein